MKLDLNDPKDMLAALMFFCGASIFGICLVVGVHKSAAVAGIFTVLVALAFVITRLLGGGREES